MNLELVNPIPALDSGKFLTNNGTILQWATVSTATPTIDQVLTAGATSASNNLTLTAGTLTSAHLKGSGLTATRIPYSDATGLIDSAGLTYDGTNVIGTGYARFDGGIGVGAAPGVGSTAAFLINFSPTSNSTVFKGLNMAAINTHSSSTTTFSRGIDFTITWQPAATTSDRICSSLQGGVATAKVDTTNVVTANNITVSNAYAKLGQIGTVKGGSHTGNLTITNGKTFDAFTPGIATGSTATHNFAYYDEGQYIDGTRTPDAWGLGINTPNNYINGNLNVGAAAASGIVNGINTVGGYAVGGVAGITATVTYVDTLLGAKTLTFTKGLLTAQV